MQIRKIIFTLFFLFFSQSHSAIAEEYPMGKKLFMNYCASCHGTSGEGNGPVASQLHKKPINLTTLSKSMGGKFDPKQIKEMIDGRLMPRAHGIPEMPIWGEWFAIRSMAKGRLQDDATGINEDIKLHLEQLTLYIKSIQQK